MAARMWCQPGGCVHALVSICVICLNVGLFTISECCVLTICLTRSLPRDVYIRRKNDHPGGQGRICVQPQFRFYAFVKARPPMWLLLHVSEVSPSSVR